MPLNATFAALAYPTRRAILARLAAEASVTELAKPFHMSQPAISRRLKVLESAGLISSGREAQRRPRRLIAKPLAGANAWLEDVVTRIFDAARQMVFDAFRKPELLKRWFGPHGWSLVVCEVDYRGGRRLFVSCSEVRRNKDGHALRLSRDRASGSFGSR